VASGLKFVFPERRLADPDPSEPQMILETGSKAIVGKPTDRTPNRKIGFWVETHARQHEKAPRSGAKSTMRAAEKRRAAATRTQTLPGSR
jgi:hypothetical protein